MLIMLILKKQDRFVGDFIKGKILLILEGGRLEFRTILW